MAKIMPLNQTRTILGNILLLFNLEGQYQPAWNYNILLDGKNILQAVKNILHKAGKEDDVITTICLWLFLPALIQLSVETMLPPKDNPISRGRILPVKPGFQYLHQDQAFQDYYQTDFANVY